jgi:MoxR-like ATPase
MAKGQRNPHLDLAFIDTPSKFWQPGTSKIQAAQASTHNTRPGNARVGSGFIEAVGRALMDDYTVFADEARIKVAVKSGKVCFIHDDLSTVCDLPSWYGPGLFSLTMARLRRDTFTDYSQEVNERWETLIQTIRDEAYDLPLTDITQAEFLFQCETLQIATLAVCDSLYCYSKRLLQDYTVSEGASPDALVDLPQQRDPFFNHAPPRVQLPVLATTTNALKWGMNLLLVGPTSTFKTSTARKAANALGLVLVDMKGQPSMEDKDFYGRVQPVDGGLKFVDGPVTRAFRSAQEHKTMLLMDEFLRFDPMYRDTLIGAMDVYTADDIRSLGETPRGNALHYCLLLTTGERVVCPKENLLFVATTNVETGFDSSVFSDALRRRFQWTLLLEYPDDAVLKPMYLGVYDDEAVVDDCLALEHFTREQQTSEGGLLERPANPAVMMSMLGTIKAMVGEGEAKATAFAKAAELTVLPYCVSYDLTGKPDKAALELLRNEVRNLAFD